MPEDPNETWRVFFRRRVENGEMEIEVYYAGSREKAPY